MVSTRTRNVRAGSEIARALRYRAFSRAGQYVRRVPHDVACWRIQQFFELAVTQQRDVAAEVASRSGTTLHYVHNAPQRPSLCIHRPGR